MDHDSSHIASSTYDPKGKTLDVTFRSGPTYRYHGVEQHTADNFHGAGSTGSFLRSRIAGKYRHTILD